MYLERLFCLAYRTYLAVQHDGGAYLVTTDREFSDVAVHFLLKITNGIVFTQCSVTDRQTDGRTDGNVTADTALCILARGKKQETQQKLLYVMDLCFLSVLSCVFVRLCSGKMSVVGDEQ